MNDLGALGHKLIEAFGWSGKHGREARLHGIVDDAIKHQGVGDKARAAISRALDDDPALMLEIIDELKFRDALVDRFMRKRVAALRERGETTIKFPRKRDGGGQESRDTQARVARPATEQDAADGGARAGQRKSDAHSADARTRTDNEIGADGADRGGQTGHDTQGTVAAPDPNAPQGAGGPGRMGRDTQAAFARPTTVGHRRSSTPHSA